MYSTDDTNNVPNTRNRSPRNMSAEVSGRGPLTRSRTALLNEAHEALGSNNPTPNGSRDEDIQPRKSHSDTGRGDGTNVGVQKPFKTAAVNEDPETTAENGQHFSDPSSVLPNKATKPLGVLPREATQTTSLGRQKLLVPPATTKGPVNERPDVHGDHVKVLKNRNLVRPTIRSRRPASPNKEESTRTSNSSKTRPGSSSRSCLWTVAGLILLLICTAMLSFLIPSVLQPSDEGKIDLSRAVKLEQFHEHFTALESSFPHQRDQLWRRSKIHLEKHLKTKEPTEPVSLIFAAGRGAEKTLHCLSLFVASSFSSAFNASVLSIDGASRAGYDSDEVKLDIDDQLEAAFEGEKPAAVIHRLEELPPSSTIIFYRYCDHQNAAYKKVFLLFTVLLPRDEITSDQSLKEVEELVQDRLLHKLVDSNPADLNRMDANMFSGLWSRISHLVLPVVAEETMETRGCEL